MTRPLKPILSIAQMHVVFRQQRLEFGQRVAD